MARQTEVAYPEIGFHFSPAKMNEKMSIEQMRKAYERDGLHQTDIDPDPLVQFRQWFDAARQPDVPDWLEVNAMTLSTTGLDGVVSSRIVLLKGVEKGRLFFYTNYESEKGIQIAENPHVALCFFWPHLERQVRVEGTASKTDRKQSSEYFHSRPRDSQLGALVSRQSTVVATRAVLVEEMERLRAQYEGQEVPCPEHWGGYEVAPTRFEFWQGRPGRLHDRLCYRKQNEQWQTSRLSP